LLTFVATPTFAQEVEESADAEDTAIVAEVAEDAAEVAEDAAEVAEDTAEAADTSFEDMIKNDPEAVENLNNAMDELLGGLEMSEEDRAEFEANFESPEDRAVAAAAL
jgi:predicted nuclease with TOPRIM domain